MIHPLGQHEMLEAQEILNFKNVCVTKSATMDKLVQDEELKLILSADATLGKKHIEQLRDLLTAQEGHK
ncbi:hypothetical protein [Ectobacillus ponti]|uniref:Uncharacterized protein n=1 Tax=Ectobacillus ponti TaxID=2961894 RepID=A0AA42BRA3_9BACI|nr:hypothetical protein [Ectobacillus ponti]MCP8969279.1 hypothetical protein [Ectobacillus ponti]